MMDETNETLGTQAMELVGAVGPVLHGARYDVAMNALIYLLAQGINESDMPRQEVIALVGEQLEALCAYMAEHETQH